MAGRRFKTAIRWPATASLLAHMAQGRARLHVYDRMSVGCRTEGMLSVPGGPDSERRWSLRLAGRANRHGQRRL